MASFLSGITSGYASEAGKRQGQGKTGILRKKTGQSKLTGMVRQYDPSTDTVGAPQVPSYKRGGKVRKTGLAKLHRGERVLTKRQAKKYRGSSKRR